jgi:hypothetical protein
MNFFSDLSGSIFTALMVLVLGSFGILGLVMLGYLAFQWLRYRKREEYSLGSVVLQVAVPRDNELKIDVAEQMFASLFSVKKSGFLSRLNAEDHFSFEIVARKEDIRFMVVCPRNLKDMLEKQVHGAYPGAEIKEVDEYNIFSQEGKVAYTQLKLKSSSFYPLKVYKDLPTDPLSSLTSALAKMGDGEGAVVQILVGPASKLWQNAGARYIAKTRAQEADPEKAQYQVDARTLEAIENKIGKPGFETSVRVVVSAANQQSAEAHLRNIANTFAQFSSDLNGLTKANIYLKRIFMINFIYRYQSLFGSRSVLSSEELATIMHFPNKQVETPHIFWLQAKRAPAPSEIPSEGMYLGKSAYRGISRNVFISETDRQRHVYIIGKTGTGKSEFMKDMIMQDIRAGKGVCFIDPHDTVEQILELIPPERAEDVIYFNPSDTERPMGLNMLEAQTEEQKHFVVSSIIGLMYKLYDPHKTGIIGPRFEHAIRNAMLTVMSEPGNTFIEVVRVLTDSKYVQEMLPKVQDPIVRRYWTDQIAQTSDFHKSEVLDYIVSKFVCD